MTPIRKIMWGSPSACCGLSTRLGGIETPAHVRPARADEYSVRLSHGQYYGMDPAPRRFSPAAGVRRRPNEKYQRNRI